MQHVNEKTTSKKLKFGLNKKTRPRMNYEWIGKIIEKKSDPKNRKNSKNQSEIAACEQKSPARKRIFGQTPFSHSTLKLEQKNSRRKTTRFFARLPVSA